MGTVRIRSVRPRGCDGPRLLIFPDSRQQDRKKGIIGEIVDAEERVVFHVDVSWSREKAGQISAAILTAVNTCGGFKAS